MLVYFFHHEREEGNIEINTVIGFSSVPFGAFAVEAHPLDAGRVYCVCHA